MPELQLCRRGVRGLWALVLPFLLGGCAASSYLPDWFTSRGSTAAAPAGAPIVAVGLPANFECPPVQIRSGAATLSVAAGGEATATNLRYQVTIASTARECRAGAAPGTISMKVGMQGRVILGPEGSGVSTITVPIRFAVVHELLAPKVISTKLDRVPVQVTPGDGSVLFSHVTEGLDFPIPRGGDIDNYVIYIGFDSASEPAPSRRAPAKPKPRASTARPAG